MNIIKEVSNLMCVSENGIHIIKDNIGGMTNHSCLISIKGDLFVVREPGKGSNELVNREHEKYVINTIMKNKNFPTPDMYINNHYIKITKYVQNSHVPNSLSEDDIIKSLKSIHKLHTSNIQVPFTYDLYDNIMLYEKLMKKSQFKEYEQVKEQILELLDIVKLCIRPKYSFTHVDFNPDNVLITASDTYLIDFEYSAMQDPDLDFAMWCIYSMYDDNMIDKFIGICTSQHVNIEYNHTIFKAKIYAYIAIAGLLWSNWCEYKKQLNQDLGNYALYQFNAAKKYSVKALNILRKIYYEKRSIIL